MKPSLRNTRTIKGRTASRKERRRWKPAEIKLLKKIYSARSNHEIADRLHRSISAVIAQAFHLQLKKNPRRLTSMGRENIAQRWGPRRKRRR